MKYFLMMFLAVLTSGLSGHAQAFNSHVESVLSGQADLSMFYQALQNTGVAQELKENTSYTLFAPTNAAFAKIQPNIYPCFYAPQCRAKVAAVLRQHILVGSKSLSNIVQQGGTPLTLDTNSLVIEEPFKGDFTVNGNRVLYPESADGLYRIDGLIASGQELAPFRAIPPADQYKREGSNLFSVYCAPIVYPGGFPASVIVYPVLGVAYGNPDVIMQPAHKPINQ